MFVGFKLKMFALCNRYYLMYFVLRYSDDFLFFSILFILHNQVLAQLSFYREIKKEENVSISLTIVRID